jgi:hypothetical protein
MGTAGLSSAVPGMSSTAEGEWMGCDRSVVGDRCVLTVAPLMLKAIDRRRS